MKALLHLFNVPTEQLADLAACAEQAGFDGVALSDHVVLPETSVSFAAHWDTVTDFDTRSARYGPETEFPDPWVAFTAMAARTERLRFVTTSYILPLRHPIAVAQAVATAAMFSGNRIDLGVAIGWFEDEFPPFHQSFAGRGARMREQIEVIRRLWSGGFEEFHGQEYDFAPLHLHQQPPDPPPRILIGAREGVGLKRAAEIGDGLITTRIDPASFARIKAEVEALRRVADRAASPFEYIALVKHAIAEDLDQLKELAFMGCDTVRVEALELAGVPAGGDATLEQRVETIKSYGHRLVVSIHAAT